MCESPANVQDPSSPGCSTNQETSLNQEVYTCFVMYIITVMVGGGGEREGVGGRARAVTIYSPILGSGGGFISNYSCISSSQ